MSVDQSVEDAPSSQYYNTGKHMNMNKDILSAPESKLPGRLDSDVSSDEESVGQAEDVDMALSTLPIKPTCHKFPQSLKWKFSGLTLWFELEEFNNDLSKAIHSLAVTHNVEKIPQSHMTAIYGMNHLSKHDAIAKLRQIPSLFPRGWPKFGKPVGVVQDLAVAGRPGQVCSIAWAELTLASNSHHEEALDKIYALFYPEEDMRPERTRPWKPHNSVAYDNPETSALSLEEVIKCVARFPTLLAKERRVQAISLWDTNGTMGEWQCLDRVRFW